MKSYQKGVIIFFLSIFLLFTSCFFMPLGQESNLELYYDPNPVYDGVYSAPSGWSFHTDIKIKETNNVGVTLGNYGHNSSCCYVELIVNGNVVERFFYDEEKVKEWFKTLYISPGDSVIQYGATFTTGNYSSLEIVETYYGKDDNGNIVSCKNTLYLQAKKKEGLKR